MLTPEQITQIISLLISGGIVGKIIDLVWAGWRDARKARGEPDFASDAELEAAFYAEALQQTREKALIAGMTSEELGPIPRFIPPPKKTEES